MDDMIRKQVYIRRRQEDFLKTCSADRGVTEADIVREALDAYEAHSGTVFRDRSAWKEEEKFIAELALTAGASEGRTWRRDELHER